MIPRSNLVTHGSEVHAYRTNSTSTNFMIDDNVSPPNHML